MCFVTWIATYTIVSSLLVNIRVHTILTVPGYGIIEQDVGRIEVDLITGEITFDARDYSFDLDALCAALAP